MLAATGMAATGAVIYFNLTVATGHMTELGDTFHKIHGTIAPLMWAYLGSHFLIAVIHKRMGHTNVKDMFSLFK